MVVAIGGRRVSNIKWHGIGRTSQLDIDCVWALMTAPLATMDGEISMSEKTEGRGGDGRGSRTIIEQQEMRCNNHLAAGGGWHQLRDAMISQTYVLNGNGVMKVGEQWRYL